MLRKHFLAKSDTKNNKGGCFFLTFTNTIILLFSQFKYLKFMANMADYRILTIERLVKHVFSKPQDLSLTHDNNQIFLHVGTTNFKNDHNISDCPLDQ